MPLNPTVFRQRATTAVVFAAVMIAGIFFGKLTFTLLFSFIGLGMAYEFFTLVLPQFSPRKCGIYAFLTMTPWWLVQSWWSPFDWLPIFVSLIFLVELFDKNSAKPFEHVGQFALAIFYIGVPMALLKILAFPLENPFESAQIYAKNRVFGLLLLTWSVDTFAYLMGSFFGKTPLFPRISPKKTWEGTILGCLLTIGLSAVFSKIFGEWTLRQWLALGVVVAIFGTLGDLVESMLKRSVGVKDSGNLMPGHGGLLDRFDAFIFILPWVWLVLKFF
jgi:phosphatidate cytidylyltransferase